MLNLIDLYTKRKTKATLIKKQNSVQEVPALRILSCLPDTRLAPLGSDRKSTITQTACKSSVWEMEWERRSSLEVSVSQVVNAV